MPPEEIERHRAHGRKRMRTYRLKHLEKLRAKARETVRADRLKNPEKHKARARAYHAANADEIKKRRAPYFEERKRTGETQAALKRSYETFWERHVQSSCKTRAKKKGLPFEPFAHVLDRPTHCPILGIELDYSFFTKGHAKPNSPSVDRIVPSLGYVPGNVQVISYRANAIKNDATPEELMKVALFVGGQA